MEQSRGPWHKDPDSPGPILPADNGRIICGERRDGELKMYFVICGETEQGGRPHRLTDPGGNAREFETFAAAEAASVEANLESRRTRTPREWWSISGNDWRMMYKNG